MVPWNKMPKDLQKAILTMIVVFGSSSAACQLGPVICDPAPPPSATPMLCDPPPPPATRTAPTPTITPTLTVTPAGPIPATPMICDPAPPPSRTPMICDPPPAPPDIAPQPPQLAPGQHFAGRIVQVSSDVGLAGAVIQGTITDQYGQPLSGLPLVVKRDGWQTQGLSDQAGTFSFIVPHAGIFSLSIEGDELHALALELNLHDVTTVEWVESWEDSLAPLPLAEIRTVDIVWEDGTLFAAETPWPGARYRWSVSGGTLIEENEGVTWQPPDEPGRYLLQVVADWGRTGLAVDALVLVVDDDGSVSFS